MKNNCFRPAREIEAEQVQRIKNKIFSNFCSGKITELESIVSVCMLIYNEHESVLVENVRSLETLPLVNFILNQYETYATQNAAHHKFALSAAEENEWRHYSSHARRGMKYLLEYLCRYYTVLAGDEVDNLTGPQHMASLSRIFISMEEMVSMYIRVDGYRYLLDDVELILDEKADLFFSVRQDLDPRNSLDVRSEKREILSRIGGPPYSHDISDHALILDPSFSEHLGASYAQIVNFFVQYIKERPTNFGMISKARVIMDLKKTLAVSGDQAELIINGFSVRAVNLEDRALFSPKQEHRAYHRGFFEFIHNGKPVLLFSRMMAFEALDILVNNTCYQKLPEEWRTPAIDINLTTLSNKSGKWFEGVLSVNLPKVGIRAISSVKTYRSHGKTIRPPSNVGEIDFIGYSEKFDALFVIEAKNVRFSTEPKLFRDDLSKFMTGNKSYAKKFIGKCSWVVENLPLVVGELSLRGVAVQDVKKVYKVMVILSPSPVESRVTGFSCVNLVQFMRVMESGNLESLVSVEVKAPD
ncbi:hypothetical protein [Pseudomonas monsensis]|uniref:hypothetical protein n=1 Tax=Pseudomonas monsensis TaxID=2745509 RepID=UPI002ABBBE1A|nr:hypothetical protein [Pseudomonas monsensis]MDZ3829429.1 hypothetical protein [Pseudomonas monsensis]